MPAKGRIDTAICLPFAAARSPEGSPDVIGRVQTMLVRPALVTLALVGLWQIVVAVWQVPPFMLPGPLRVLAALAARPGFWWENALVTSFEALCGLLAGSLAGGALALGIVRFPAAGRFLLPTIVVSQALPVFAIAPLLVLWLGFGFGSKIVMATIAIFFPVAAAFHDGLRATDGGLLDLGRLYGASPGDRLLLLQVPSALPSLASGLRLAAVYAPIGALVGEWVGASSGLGYVMLQANARSQTDVVFAALLIVAVLAVALRAAVDSLTKRLVFWAPDSSN